MRVASQNFLAYGFEGASIDMIATAAGASKATIYAAFGSKAALFEAVALHTVSALRGDVHDISTQGRDPAEVLFDFALRIAGEVAQPDRTALLRLAIAAKDRFPDVAGRLHAHIADTAAPIRDYLRLLAEQDYAVDEPAALAAHFINLANGGLRFLLTDDFADEGFRRTWSRQVADLFLCGIRKPGQCQADRHHRYIA